MARKFNYERAATVLADAILTGDEAAAKKWNVSVRSIELWRVRLNTDPILAELFAKLHQVKQRDWIEDLPEAIAAGIAFLKRAATEANHRNPEVILAIDSGLKTLTHIELTRKVVDAQISQLKSTGYLSTTSTEETDEGFEDDTRNTIDAQAEEIQ